MSTILDALNRAERERRMGELPPIERLLEPRGLDSLPPERQFPGRATIITVVFMVGLGLVAATVALMRNPPQADYLGPLMSLVGASAPEAQPAATVHPSDSRRVAAPDSNLSLADNSRPPAAPMPEARSAQAPMPEQAAAPDGPANKRVPDSAAQNRAAQDRAAQDRAAQDRAARERAAKDRAAQDRAAQDNAARDKSSHNKAAAARSGPDAPQAQTAAGKQTGDYATPPGVKAEREPAALASSRIASTPATTPAAPARTAKQAAATAPAGTDKANGAEKPVPGLHELPASLRQQLPEIKLGGYIYSPNPAARSILINGKLLREGDQLVTGLRLEQMRPDGVVFEYKDVRFRMAY